MADDLNERVAIAETILHSHEGRLQHFEIKIDQIQSDQANIKENIASIKTTLDNHYVHLLDKYKDLNDKVDSVVLKMGTFTIPKKSIFAALATIGIALIIEALSLFFHLR